MAMLNNQRVVPHNDVWAELTGHGRGAGGVTRPKLKTMMGQEEK